MNFMDTSGAQFKGVNSVDTPNKQKVRRLQNIVPICVRQLRDCQGEEFSLFGMRPQILTLVGILRDLDVSSTKAIYTIEDHTGSVTAVLWLDSESQSSVNLPNVKEGHYLRIYGSVRVVDGNKTLLVLKMLPITNINEITMHLLEVIQVRFASEKAAHSGGIIQKIVQNNPTVDLANSMSVLYSGAGLGGGFTAIQAEVHALIKNNNTEEGSSTQAILARYKPHQHTEVHKAIDYLQSEGHVYTTVDNNHFKATDC